MGLQAVIADLAHLRALAAALHEAQESLLRHPWGLCSVDACALVQDMQARLDQRLMHHRQGLTQVVPKCNPLSPSFPHTLTPDPVSYPRLCRRCRPV